MIGKSNKEGNIKKNNKKSPVESSFCHVENIDMVHPLLSHLATITK
jgi:hypothetical protein